MFQFRGDKPISLLRIPKTAPALPPLKGREHAGSGATAAASRWSRARRSRGYRAGLAGGIVISTPVDLTAIRRALADHATRATLTGLGSDLVLVGRADGTGDAPIKLADPVERRLERRRRSADRDAEAGRRPDLGLAGAQHVRRARRAVLLGCWSAL